MTAPKVVPPSREVNPDFVPRSQYDQLLTMLAESEQVIHRHSQEILAQRAEMAMMNAEINSLKHCLERFDLSGELRLLPRNVAPHARYRVVRVPLANAVPKRA